LRPCGAGAGRSRRPAPPRASVQPTRTDRGHGRNSGRPAADVPLAACPVPGEFGRGAGKAGAGMVARGGRAHPRLLPGRGFGRAAFLALPSGSLFRARRHAALVPAWSLRMTYAEFSIHSNFSFLEGASHAEEHAMAAKQLGLAAFA